MNRNLADFRAAAVERLIENQLLSSLGWKDAQALGDKIHVRAGEEVDEDDLAHTITWLAKASGVSPRTYVQVPNRTPDRELVSDQRVIDDAFDRDRSVLVEIVASRGVKTLKVDVPASYTVAEGSHKDGWPE